MIAKTPEEYAGYLSQFTSSSGVLRAETIVAIRRSVEDATAPLKTEIAGLKQIIREIQSDTDIGWGGGEDPEL